MGGREDKYKKDVEKIRCIFVDDKGINCLLIKKRKKTMLWILIRIVQMIIMYTHNMFS